MLVVIMICSILTVLISLACFGEINKIRIAVEKKPNTDLIDNLNKLTEWSNTVKKNRM